MRFHDREEAGHLLAHALVEYKEVDAVVLALPRGGVPIAAVIAREIKAPLDLIIVRKIGVPHYPEVAMGAVADADIPFIVRNEKVLSASGISKEEFSRECEREMGEIQRRRALYLGKKKRVSLQGRVVIVVDDGIATGATTQAALRAVRSEKPKSVILAVPVASKEALSLLKRETDKIVCLHCPQQFHSVGYYYNNFDQVDDREVLDLITIHNP